MPRCSWAEPLPGANRVTLGADQGDETQDFIAELRHVQITRTCCAECSEASQRHRRATTRHAGYQVSQKKRKASKKYGLDRVGWMFTSTAADNRQPRNSWRNAYVQCKLGKFEDVGGRMVYSGDLA